MSAGLNLSANVNAAQLLLGVKKGGPPSMDYFTSQAILVMGIIIGITITLSFQMAWNEFKQAKRHAARR